MLHICLSCEDNDYNYLPYHPIHVTGFCSVWDGTLFCEPSVIVSKKLILMVLKLEYFGKGMTIAWLLMPCTHALPGHQQPWYWLCRINRSLSFMGKEFNYLHNLIITIRFPILEWWHLYLYWIRTQAMFQLGDDKGPCSSCCCSLYQLGMDKHLQDYFVNAPSQWETTLHCNVISQWLGAYTNDPWFVLRPGWLASPLLGYMVPATICIQMLMTLHMATPHRTSSDVICRTYAIICFCIYNPQGLFLVNLFLIFSKFDLILIHFYSKRICIFSGYHGR